MRILTISCVLALICTHNLAQGGELHEAAARGDLAALKAIFAEKSSVDVNETDLRLGTALHYAANADNPKIAEFLISHGADIEAVGELQGMHPLHLAVDAGSRSTIEVLLDAGADVMAVDGIHKTALVRAAIAGKKDILKLLLDYDAPVDQRDEVTGQTALIAAANSGQVGSVVTLLDAGADINARDFRGKSAIWYATNDDSYKQAGGPVLLKLLAERGANLESPDNTGMTPLAWARAGFGQLEIYHEIASVLIELGAKK
jgi:ankyrin repeat protein